MKNRILYGSILLLFVINGIQLYVQLSHGNHHPPRPREVIIETLGFSVNQIASYDELIAQHQKDIRKIEDELLLRKEDLHKKVLVENENIEHSDLSKVLEVYMRLEKIHVSHFQDIKSLCTKDQLPKFYDLAPRLAEMFRPKPPKRN